MPVGGNDDGAARADLFFLILNVLENISIEGVWIDRFSFILNSDSTGET